MKSFHVDWSAILQSTMMPKILTLISWVFIIHLFINLVQYINKPQVQADKIQLPVKMSNQKNIEPSYVLFGLYMPSNLKDVNIQQSLLDVHVVGIMYSVHEEHSQVLLSAGNGAEKIYRVGDKIPGDAIIKKIEPHSIVILSHGRLERIEFPKNTLKFENQSRLIFKE